MVMNEMKLQTKHTFMKTIYIYIQFALYPCITSVSPRQQLYCISRFHEMVHSDTPTIFLHLPLKQKQKKISRAINQQLDQLTSSTAHTDAQHHNQKTNHIRTHRFLINMSPKRSHHMPVQMLYSSFNISLLTSDIFLRMFHKNTSQALGTCL